MPDLGDVKQPARTAASRRLGALSTRDRGQTSAKLHGTHNHRSPYTGENYLFIPFAAAVYAIIIAPLLLTACDLTDAQCLAEPPDRKMFWPIIASISLVIALRGVSRLGISTSVTWLFAYLSLAGLSVIWSANPAITSIRFVEQSMVVVSILLPAMISNRRYDLMDYVFFCFFIGTSITLVTLAFRPPTDIGHPGYFTGKNIMGQFAATAFIIGLFRLGTRRFRLLALMLAIAGFVLVLASNSKTSLGLALLAPVLATLSIGLRRLTRVSTAAIPLAILAFYFALSNVSNFNVSRLSYIIYGDPTFTGRTVIWDAVAPFISARPVLGWGYLSFWLAGPTSPSTGISSWVGTMPHAHNGYVDATLQLGYLGLFVLTAFLISTVHAAGRVADKDFTRGCLLLSIVLFIILNNGLETTWLRGADPMWVTFLLIVGEIYRSGHVDGARRSGAVVATTRSRAPGPVNLSLTAAGRLKKRGNKYRPKPTTEQ